MFFINKFIQLKKEGKYDPKKQILQGMSLTTT